MDTLKLIFANPQETAQLNASELTSFDDILDVITFTFYMRSIKNGEGNREVFYRMFSEMYSEFPEIMTTTFDFIVNPFTGGYWGDLNRIVEYIQDHKDSRLYWSISDAVANFMANKLFEDYTALSFDDEADISLASKYAPSEGTHFWKLVGRNVASRLYVLQFKKEGSHAEVFKNYRQVNSILRKKLDIVERKMCTGDWSGIKFEDVPVKAMRRLGQYAFANRDYFGNPRTYLKDREVCSEIFFRFCVESTKTRKSSLRTCHTSVEDILQDPNFAPIREKLTNDFGLRKK